MIAIDMPMPENCARCMFRSISSVLLKKTFICYATLPRRKLAEVTPDERLRFKPSWCPLIDLTDDGKQASYRQVKLTWRYARKETAAK